MEQIQGLWKVRHQNMSHLYEEARKLKDRFLSFEIKHVLRVSKVNSTPIACGLSLCSFLWECIIPFKFICGIIEW